MKTIIRTKKEMLDSKFLKELLEKDKEWDYDDEFRTGIRLATDMIYIDGLFFIPRGIGRLEYKIDDKIKMLQTEIKREYDFELRKFLKINNFKKEVKNEKNKK